VLQRRCELCEKQGRGALGIDKTQSSLSRYAVLNAQRPAPSNSQVAGAPIPGRADHASYAPINSEEIMVNATSNGHAARDLLGEEFERAFDRVFAEKGTTVVRPAANRGETPGSETPGASPPRRSRETCRRSRVVD
jgi:hypothetical protein